MGAGWGLLPPASRSWDTCLSTTENRRLSSVHPGSWSWAPLGPPSRREGQFRGQGGQDPVGCAGHWGPMSLPVSSYAAKGVSLWPRAGSL